MNRITQSKGDIGFTQAIADFTSQGYEVLLPITESATYDLVVDKDGSLYKIQCKFLGEDVRGVDLRRIHSNSKGYVSKKYEDGDFDYLYVYRKSVASYLVEGMAGRSFYTPKKEHLFVNHA